MRACSRCAISTMSARSSRSMGPGAFFDLPWLPFYLAICFAFHVMIGLTALVGAIILVTLTVITEYHVAHAGARGHGPGGAPQRSGRHQPAQRRSAGRDGNGRTPDQALERGQPEISRRQPARQRRLRRSRRDRQGPAHDAAVGGARGRRLSRDPSGGDRRHHHRGLDPECAGAGAGRSGHRALEGFCRRAAELAPPQPAARTSCRREPNRRCCRARRAAFRSRASASCRRAIRSSSCRT